MLREGIYGLRYSAAAEGPWQGGGALAVLRDGRILGSDPWGGVFAGSCEFDAAACTNKLSLRFTVPPQGELITGFCAGPDGAVLDIIGACPPNASEASMVVDVAGAPVSVHFTYLGPLPL
jgi:hypothetical protein